MTRLSISRWSSLFFRFPSPISPQHSLGEADLWLAPHRGSEATGVVYQDPPTNNPLHPISPQKRKISTKKSQKSARKKSQKSARKKSQKSAQKNLKNQHEKNLKNQHEKGPTDVVDPLAVICKREILLFCCFFSLRSFNCFCLWS